MKLTLEFFLISIGLGIGLAMDAFSVSIADGLKEPNMKKSKILFIALVFAIFQALMPLIGWVCVHTVLKYFKLFEKFIPWISLFLLSYIGIKMIVDGVKNKEDESIKVNVLTFSLLMIQGIATSIDALSAGFSIAEYNFSIAIICISIIAIITFIICSIGVIIGKSIGSKLSNKAQIFGGIILIIIGLEIFIKGII